jgi:hypothetical protein
MYAGCAYEQFLAGMPECPACRGTITHVLVPGKVNSDVWQTIESLKESGKVASLCQTHAQYALAHGLSIEPIAHA